MKELDYILKNDTKAEDFDPRPNKSIAGQTEACRKVIESIETHVKALSACTDKNTFQVYNDEIGMRFFQILCNHIKTTKISTDGGMQLLSDVTHYYNFLAKRITAKRPIKLYQQLKDISTMFIIDSTEDLKKFINEQQEKKKYDLSDHDDLTMEDIFEMMKMRKDYYKIEKWIDRQRSECVVM
jgi:recyclin-1